MVTGSPIPGQGRARALPRSLACLIGAAAAVTVSSSRTEETGLATETAWTMPNSEVRKIESASGESYRILISWPETEEPENGYPVLYILDGDESFPLAASIHRIFTRSPKAAEFGGVDPGIIVAIGYPGESRRSYDYTPPAEKREPEKTLEGTPYEYGENGGADEFLDFIETRLKPSVETDFAVDRSRQALMGHSYGGLFTLHVLFTRPETFQTYIASSPSIWWNQRSILDEEKIFASRLKKQSRNVTLVMTMGEYEQSLAPREIHLPLEEQEGIAHHRGQRRMLDNSREMAWRLEHLEDEGLALTYRIFRGETHGSVAAAAMSHAMPFAFPRR